MAGSEYQLQQLLQRANYNAELALNQYYDRGLPPDYATPAPKIVGACSHGNGPDCPSCTSLNTRVASSCGRDSMYFLGQRLIVGICTTKLGRCRAGQQVSVQLDGHTRQSEGSSASTSTDESSRLHRSDGTKSVVEPSATKGISEFFSGKAPAVSKITGGSSGSKRKRLMDPTSGKASRRTGTSNGASIQFVTVGDARHEMTGRLPKPLADALEPLLRLQLVGVHASACCDFTPAPLFAEVPLLLRFTVHPAAFALPEVDAAASITPDFSSRDPHIFGRPEPLPFRLDDPTLPAASAGFFRLLQWIHDNTITDLVGATQASAMERQASGASTEDNQDENEVPINAADASFLVGEGTTVSDTVSTSTKSSPRTSSSSYTAPSETESIVNPPQLSLNLKPFQLHAVTWMLQREAAAVKLESEDGDDATPDDTEAALECSDGGVIEKGLVGVQRAEDDIALWEERWVVRHWQVDRTGAGAEEKLELRDGLRFWLNPYGRRWRTELPPKPCGTAGGILADEMGLGKTVMILGLLCSDKNNRLAAQQAAANSGDGPAADGGLTKEQGLANSKGRSNGGTLVVCPMSLIQHWYDELTRHTQLRKGDQAKGEIANAGPLTVCIYYGNDRAGSNLTSGTYDVVVTSYGVLSSEFGSGAATSGIYQMNWRRVVLDEAHTIKNTGTAAAVAVRALKAARRWAVTGTPLQNGLGDVFALLRALHHEPWCEPIWWREAVTKPHLKGDPSALNRLRAVLQPLMIRRTKATLGEDGQPIVSLPSKEVVTVSLTFSSAEREFYDSLLARSRGVINRLVASGTAATSYIQMLTLLLRLRQACSHPFLLLGNEFTRQILKDETASHRSRSSRGLSGLSGDSPTTELDAAASDPTHMEEEGLTSVQSADPTASSDLGEASTSDVSDLYLRALMGKFGAKNEASKHGAGDGEGQDDSRVAFLTQVSQSITSGLEECAVCLEPPSCPTLLHCGHTFCRACLLNCFAADTTKNTSSVQAKGEDGEAAADGLCPLCEEPVVLAKVLAVDPTRGPVAAFSPPRSSDANTTTTTAASAAAAATSSPSLWLGKHTSGSTISKGRDEEAGGGPAELPTWRSSTKLDWLKSHLTSLHRNEPHTKVRGGYQRKA